MYYKQQFLRHLRALEYLQKSFFKIKFMVKKHRFLASAVLVLSKCFLRGALELLGVSKTAVYSTRSGKKHKSRGRPSNNLSIWLADDRTTLLASSSWPSSLARVTSGKSVRKIQFPHPCGKCISRKCGPFRKGRPGLRRGNSFGCASGLLAYQLPVTAVVG